MPTEQPDPDSPSPVPATFRAYLLSRAVEGGGLMRAMYSTNAGAAV